MKNETSLTTNFVLVLPTVRRPSLVKLHAIKMNSNEIYFKYIQLISKAVVHRRS